MRKLATIEEIKNIIPIEGADAIEKVQVRDWYCVAKKGEFKLGDKCIYFEIDSLLPIIPQFDFLKNRGTKKTLVDGKEVEGYRLKTIRLRGSISQGLALPIKNFDLDFDSKIGTDVTEKLGIYKYERILRGIISGDVKGYMPSNIHKTDEERIQNCGYVLEKYKDDRFVVTEKIDGTSSTFYFNNGNFGICGRNMEFKTGEENSNHSFMKINKELDIEKKLRKLGKNIAIQGEVAGPGIQKNILKLSKIQLFVFNIWDIDKAQYLDYSQFLDIVKLLNLPTVPVLSDNFKLPDSVDALLKIADSNSLVNPNSIREGIVLKTFTEKSDTELERISFKVISNNFLLKGND